MGNTRPRPTSKTTKTLPKQGIRGADDEIRTRDPHLGKKKEKVVVTVRPVRLLLRSAPQSAKPSGKSVWSVQFVYRSTIVRSESPDESRYSTRPRGDSIAAMPWGVVELEPEVVSWLDSLTENQFGQVERYIDLLADQGVHLSEPFTRQLDGKLRELRFYLDRQPTRISYYIATGRIIVLLTVFTKTRSRERAEIDRARRAMQRCITDGHLSEEQPT